MQQLPHDYVLQQTIPKKGGYGEIYICSKNDKKYAMKVFVKNVEQYLHEVNLCTTLRKHINIVQLIDHFEWDGKKVIVLEYCCQDLLSYLQENKQLTEQERLHLFAQIVSAFKSIFDDLSESGMNFQHRDIKPENLMLGEDNHIKIIDFGESRLQDEDDTFPTMKTSLCGTRGFMDPMMEYGNEGFQHKSDLWSLGATLYFLLMNQRLPIESSQIISKSIKIPQSKRKEFKLNLIQQMIDSALQKLPYSNECKHLLDKLLRVLPSERMGWEELFTNELVNIFQPDKQNTKRKIIKLSEQLSQNFVSMTFKNLAGPIVTEAYYVMLSKGQHCILTAQKMFRYFNEQKAQFIGNWQIFEKCHYLLHLRSLIVLNSYNQMLTLKCNKYYREQIPEILFNDLINNPQNQQTYERIQLQIYYHFENVRKAMQGDGLENRLRNLTRLSTKEGEENEYNQVLQFEGKEKEYFQYQKNDEHNIKNRPESYDNEYFYLLYKEILNKCIAILLKNQDVEGILSDLIVSRDLDAFYTNCSIERIQSYKFNKLNQNPEVWFAKLKVIYNS